MRIITEANVDQLLSLTEGDDIKHLTGLDNLEQVNEVINKTEQKGIPSIKEKTPVEEVKDVKPFLPTFLHIPFNKLASPIKFATNWLAGFSYIEFGSPICCISPSLITAILSDIVKASSWSCVTKTNVIPVSL